MQIVLSEAPTQTGLVDLLAIDHTRVVVVVHTCAGLVDETDVLGVGLVARHVSFQCWVFLETYCLLQLLIEE